MVKIIRTIDMAKAVLYLSLATLGAILVLTTVFTLGLFADGSYMLMAMLADFPGNFFFSGASIGLPSGREFSYVLQQFIPVLAQNLGEPPIRFLIHLHSFNYGFAFAALWALCLYYAYTRENKNYLYLTSMLMAVVLLFNGFFVTQEILPAIPLFWFLFLFFLNCKGDESFKIKIGILILAVVSARLYQAGLFFAGIVFVVIGFRLWKKELALTFFHIVNLLLMSISAMISLYYTIFPPDPGNAHQFMDTFQNISLLQIFAILLLFLALAALFFIKDKKIFGVYNILFYASGCLALAVCAVMGPAYFLQPGAQKRLFIPILIAVTGWILNAVFLFIMDRDRILFVAQGLLLFGSAAVCLYLAATRAVTLASECYFVRPLATIIPLAFMCFVLISRLLGTTREAPVLGYASPFFLCSALIMFAISGYGYQSHLNTIVEETSYRTGTIVVEETRLWDSPFSWFWSIPSESILAQAKQPGKTTIDTVIVQNKKDIYWEPYDSYIPAQYPDLSPYGLTYDYEKLAASMYPAYFNPSEASYLDAYCQGVYFNEGELHWTGPESVIPLKREDSLGDTLTIKMDIPQDTINNKYEDDLILSISVNGNILLSQTITEPGYRDFYIPVSEIPVPDDSVYRIGLSINGAFVPSELGITEDDDRELSLMLYYIG